MYCENKTYTSDAGLDAELLKLHAIENHHALSDAAKVKLVVLLCCRESVPNHHGNSHRPHPSRDGGQQGGYLGHLIKCHVSYQPRGAIWLTETRDTWRSPTTHTVTMLLTYAVALNLPHPQALPLPRRKI